MTIEQIEQAVFAAIASTNRQAVIDGPYANADIVTDYQADQIVSRMAGALLGRVHNAKQNEVRPVA